MTADPIADLLRDVRAIAAARASRKTPYDKDDPVSWQDIHGRPRDAVVVQARPEEIEIRIDSSLGDTCLMVHPDELSPR